MTTSMQKIIPSKQIALDVEAIDENETDDFESMQHITEPLFKLNEGAKASEANSTHRSLDDFLDKAYVAHPSSSKFWYYIVILSLAIGNSSDASEILFISFTLSDPTFESEMLKNDVAGNGGMVAASVFLGMLVGGSLIGSFSDKYGRKPTLLFGLIVNSLAGALSAFSPNVESLTVVRFIAGIGIGKFFVSSI